MKTTPILDTEEEELPISKSQVKRDLLVLHELGFELVGLPKKSLSQILLSDDIREAIAEAKRLKMEPLRRKLKHVGKLMRDEDVDAICTTLAALRKPHEEKVSRFHEVEEWRDKLMAGDDELIGELCARFAGIDRQHFRQLVRNGRKELALDKSPKSARALFKYLQEMMDAPAGE